MTIAALMAQWRSFFGTQATLNATHDSESVGQVLDGVRVVEFSRGMAGPLASMVLADNGADVIKVEPPAGDPARSMPGWNMWNRGKRSAILDLGIEEDLAAAISLVKGSDVVIQDSGPFVVGLGLDRTSLATLNPRLVSCSISAFGALTSCQQLPADDAVVMAKSGRFMGLDALSGAAEANRGQDRPIFVVPPLGSYGAALLAVQSIASGLLLRETTGSGSHYETSLLAGVSAATMRLDWAREGDQIAPSHANASSLIHRGISLTFLTVECSDGRYIQMCARQVHHYRNWLKALGLDEELQDPRFSQGPLAFQSHDDIDWLEERIRARMLERSQSEWMRVFTEEFDVGADPFLEPGEFLSHPDVVCNERAVTIWDPDRGPIKQMGKLVSFSRTPSRIERAAPRLGAHQSVASTVMEAKAPDAVRESGMSLPLAGVQIVELAGFLAGPFGATLLAELGARVIKVEPLGGDSWRSVGVQFAQYVKGKESLALDLKKPAGRDVLHRLIGRADALLHNFRSGVPQRLGFDYDTVRDLNPRIVYLTAASYGSQGPQRSRPAFHSTPNALCGGGVLQAGDGNAPVDDSYPDTCAGLAVGAALALGLLAEARYGVGQTLETTMLASAGYVHSNALTLYEGASTRRPDRGQHGLSPLYRLYECAGSWLFLAAEADEDWERLARALGQSVWLKDARFSSQRNRQRNAEELAYEMGEVLKARTSKAWEEELVSSGIVAVDASGTSFEEFHLRSGLLRASRHPDFGDHWLPAPRVHVFGATEPSMSPAGVGEHTEQILLELGYSDSDIAALFASEVVA